MSVTHFWLGTEAVKFCSNKLGATGLLWLESVVTLNFRLALAVSSISFIRFATILRVHAIPLYFNFTASLLNSSVYFIPLAIFFLAPFSDALSGKLIQDQVRLRHSGGMKLPTKL